MTQPHGTAKSRLGDEVSITTSLGHRRRGGALLCGAERVLGRVGQADPELVRQPRRGGHPDRARQVVQHRRLRHRDPAAAVRRDRPAHPARAPARGQGLVHGPDEPRPRLRRRVRQRRLAGAAARRHRERGHRRRRPGRAQPTTVTWDDGVYAFPQWANTQVLWYRKSLAEAAGLDMTQPVTWDQIIDAAADNGGTVGVQANKYEGYVVLDQRAHPGRRRRHHLGQRGRQGRDDRHRLRRRSRRRHGHPEAGARRRPPSRT